MKQLLTSLIPRPVLLLYNNIDKHWPWLILSRLEHQLCAVRTYSIHSDTSAVCTERGQIVHL